MWWFGYNTPSWLNRPRGETGRPVSGVVRPNTQCGRASSLEAALRTPRTARSARPSTSQSARTVRLGTASMMSQPDGPFIQVCCFDCWRLKLTAHWQSIYVKQIFKSVLRETSPLHVPTRACTPSEQMSQGTTLKQRNKCLTPWTKGVPTSRRALHTR